MNFNFYKVAGIVLVVVVVIVIFGFSKINNECSEKESMPMSIVVDEGARMVVGFNTDKDHLNFGKVSSESSVKRSIIVGPPGAKVKILLKGEMADWVSVSENNFDVSESKEIAFLTTVPSGVMAGNYTGEAIFCFND